MTSFEMQLLQWDQLTQESHIYQRTDALLTLVKAKLGSLAPALTPDKERLVLKEILLQ